MFSMGFRFQGFYHLFGGGIITTEERYSVKKYSILEFIWYQYCDQSKKEPTPQQTRGMYVYHLKMSGDQKPSSTVQHFIGFSRK